MYDETNVPGPEYRVRPVVRYIVTRYCHPYQSKDGMCSSSGHSEVIAEFPSEQRAMEVSRAMAKAESEDVLGAFGAAASVSDSISS